MKSKLLVAAAACLALSACKMENNGTDKAKEGKKAASSHSQSQGNATSPSNHPTTAPSTPTPPPAVPAAPSSNTTNHSRLESQEFTHYAESDANQALPQSSNQPSANPEVTPDMNHNSVQQDLPAMDNNAAVNNNAVDPAANSTNSSNPQVPSAY